MKPRYILTPAGPALKEAPSMTLAYVRARLVERGTSYRQWALANGYQPRTVTQAVNRWAGKRDLPRGRLTYRILRDLSRYLGTEVVRGVLEAAA
jgi:gp16 family phage-associated protein